MYLGKPEKKSRGGICKLEVYDLENGVSSFSDIQDLQLFSPPTFPGGFDWEELNFQRWSAKLDENRRESNGADLYSFTLSCVIHLDSADRFHILHDAQRKEYLIKVTDLNGIVRIIGNPDEPVSIISQKRSIGAKFQDGTKMEVLISATNRNPFPQL